MTEYGLFWKDSVFSDATLHWTEGSLDVLEKKAKELAESDKTTEVFIMKMVQQYKGITVEMILKAWEEELK